MGELEFNWLYLWDSPEILPQKQLFLLSFHIQNRGFDE